MDPGDRTTIRAYLLRRLSDEERDAFEARVLEERNGWRIGRSGWPG